MREKLNDKYKSGEIKFGEPVIPEFYSGSFEAGLGMLELMQDNVPIVVAVGGYSEKTTINNDHVKCVLNFYGSEDLLCQTIPGFGKKYFNNVETLNIKIEGVGHDYYQHSEVATFIARAKIKLTKSRTEFEDFINQYKISEENGEKIVKIPEL
ncbi:hypothetical protein OMAG_002444 [Candidatus Omnitrophus magneticus]|uniref:Uncharacterized protein n=1 Tax=Candidatus Omnitrophus magneticus TaxID=1609969 RepID=A0A0F0CK71_9BACT|nr:hypothetical protein OMAG_002444 [Candidatus Omnitrophus magneticus]